jgi:hypothetical protein
LPRTQPGPGDEVPGVGKRFMSQPISDTMAEADRVLIPGTVLRSSIRVRKGTSPLALFVCRRPIR